MPVTATRTAFATIHAPRLDWLARAAPEPVLEPDLPIVDAHLHLWQPPNGYRYYLEEYAQDLANCGHNVEASVYEECFHMYRTHGPAHLKYVGETEFAVGQAAMAASGKYTSSRVAAGIVGHGDLMLGERLRELLEAHIDAGNGRFRGVRQLAKWDADAAVRGKYSAAGPHLYLDPEFGRGIDVLNSLGLSFDASIFHPQIPDVAGLARAHPDANIVLVHCGSPVGHGPYAGRESENHAAWLASMKNLAKCPNVSIKMGGILINLANFDFATAEAPPTSAQLADLWRPYIEPCIELFGAERCMVSSNFPVDKAGFGYATVWNMFKHITAGASEDEKKMIFSGTAKRVYRLD
ncbi:amidohydrolase family protein [Variovorax rhizosphaerae]|uniref:Amidohydrolase family protein n=1 Tax=Variovorax rhizosphaerae TaxID=1836200 RepID=A0ABU8WUL8_9BURK